MTPEREDPTMGIEIGVLHMRRSAFLRATPERVWEECHSFERLAAWFGTGHVLEIYEPEPGGQVRLSVEIDGTQRAFGGSIVAFEPARELSFSNHWEPESWPVPLPPRRPVARSLRAIVEG